jgi:hypothetical protein
MVIATNHVHASPSDTQLLKDWGHLVASLFFGTRRPVWKSEVLAHRHRPLDKALPASLPVAGSSVCIRDFALQNNVSYAKEGLSCHGRADVGPNEKSNMRNAIRS